MICIGLKSEKTVEVNNNNIAKNVGSGDLPVFSTPAMITLIEKTTNQSIKPFLDENHSTVGTLVNIKHISPSPVGIKITCYVELINVKDKHLTFNVKVFDEKGLIGEGIHERHIIKNEKFLSKVNQKLK